MGWIPASPWRRGTRFGALGVALALMLGLPAGAQAATFSVNDLNDAPLVNDAQGCQSTDDGLCTLRAALQAADLASGDTTVNLPAGTYELTRAQTSDRADDGSIGNLVVDNASGDDATNTVTINGAGAGSTTIEGMWDLTNGGVPDRVLEVIGGHGAQSSDQVDAQISGVTITGGDLQTPEGCESPVGGGLLVADGATVTLDRSTVSANRAAGDGGGVGVLDDAFCDGVGGQAATQPAVTVANSTIASNTAGDDGGGFAGSGFGTYVFTGDTFSENTAGFDGGAYDGTVGFAGDSGFADAASFTNDTITGNVASNGDGGGIAASIAATPTDDGARPALVAGGTPTASLTNVTVNANLAPDSGGNLAAGGGTISLQNTIVADGSAPQPPGNVSPELDVVTNCDGNVQSLGHNLFDNGGSDCGAVATDVTNPAVGIGLDALLPNGGPTDTEALQATSPALDAADASACPSVDQRSVTRGSPCDIGAFELDADLGVDASAAPNPSAVGTPTTATFTVGDSGADPASDTTFTLPIPANADLSSDAASAGSCSGTATVTCSLGDIGSSGATPGLATPALSTGATVTVTLVPTGGSSLSLTGTASSTVPHLNSADTSSATLIVPLQAATPTPTPASTPAATPTPTVTPTPVAAGGVKAATTIVPPVTVLPTAEACTSVRDFLIHIQNVVKDHLVSAVIYVNGHRETTVRHHLSAAVDLRNLPYGTFVVRIVARTNAGRTIVGERTYHTCRGRPLPPHKRLKL